jgi:hypothetical protein
MIFPFSNVTCCGGSACAFDHPKEQSNIASAKLNALNMQSSLGVSIGDAE